MRHVTFLLVFLGSLLLCACGGRVYRNSWQPDQIEHQQGLPRLLSEALVVHASDLDRIASAGGAFIGHHEARKGWARRAASTGGTHFIAVEYGQASTRTRCIPLGNAVFCESSSRSNYSRVAVFRVPPERWRELSPHLIPPLSVLLPGVRASAYREGCRVHNSLGTTRCSRRTRVVVR